jgi:hypothetical protein
MNDKEVAGWKRNAALASLLVLSLQGFAARIIRYVQGGGILDDAALTAIKDDCIRNLKNMEATGLPIETEADVFTEAIAHLEQIMDRAIAEARQLGVRLVHRRARCACPTRRQESAQSACRGCIGSCRTLVSGIEVFDVCRLPKDIFS